VRSKTGQTGRRNGSEPSARKASRSSKSTSKSRQLAQNPNSRPVDAASGCPDVFADPRQAAEWAEKIILSLHEPLVLLESELRIVSANRSFYDLFEITPDKAKGKQFPELGGGQWEVPELTERLRRIFRNGGSFENFELKLRRSKGAEGIVLLNARILHSSEGKPALVLLAIRDTTEREPKEERLHRLNRVLRALSDSNQAMMRSSSELDYLNEVCRLIIKDCGYSMVWIGFAENDEDKTVRPVCQAGFEEGYLETVNITWAATERGRGPTGTAIRTRKPAVCRNMLTDPNFKPWRKEALKRGYASSIVLPLLSEGRAFGAVNIYSKRPDPFSREEIELLTELSNDLAYGLMTFRLRQKREEAEAAVARSEEKYRFLYEEGQSFNLIIGTDQTIKDVNKTVLDLLGYRKEEVIGRPALEFVPEEERARAAGLLTESFSGGTNQENEIPVLAKDGSLHTILFAAGQATLMDGESIAGVVVTGIDITERKQAEEVVRKARDLLEVRVKERTAELEEANRRLKEENEERLRSEQSLRVEQARLDALYSLSQISEAPAAELAAFALDQGIALTGSKIGFMGFLSEDEAVYTLHAVSRDVVKECNVSGDPMQWHVAGAGVWAEAIRQRRTLFMNDYSQPHPAKKGFPPGHPPVNKFMVVPVFEGGRIVALAGMGNKPTDYDKSDERQVALLLAGMWNYVQKNRSQEALEAAYGELERRVEQRTAELKASTAALKEEVAERKRAAEALQASNEELERFNRAMVGREMRMIGLKQEINKLCNRLGQPPQYRVDFGEALEWPDVGTGESGPGGAQKPSGAGNPGPKPRTGRLDRSKS
jgi:PAS domain S-box-containing protein